MPEWSHGVWLLCDWLTIGLWNVVWLSCDSHSFDFDFKKYTFYPSVNIYLVGLTYIAV